MVRRFIPLIVASLNTLDFEARQSEFKFECCPELVCDFEQIA